MPDPMTPQALQQLAMMGLGGMAGNGPATESALMERLRADIEAKSGTNAQAINENTFARGLGSSSITAGLQGENERARSDALGKARNDAFLGSQQAQLSALGQAAGVAQNQINSQQQASQFGANQAMQKKGLKQQQSMANQGALTTGLAGLTGAGLQTAGRIFGPEIKSGARGLFGLDKPGGGGGAGAAGGSAPPGLPDLGAAMGGDIGGGFPAMSSPDFGAAFADSGVGGGDFGGLEGLSMSGLDFGGLDMGGFDLSAWLQPTDTYDWGGYY